jgi:hypothetical protein
MTVRVSHDALLTRANKARAAASDHDVDRLQREVGALLDGFVAHVEQERPQLRHLSSFSARMVERGQERLLAELVALLAEVEDEVTVDDSRCERRCDEVVVQLALQTDAERRTFTRAGLVASLPSDR